MKRITYLLFLVPALLFADDVYVKGGAKFSGRIVKQTESMITVDLGDGEIGFPMSRVTKIVKGPSPLDVYDQRAAALKPDDVDGWRSLGQWASQQGLSKQSTQAYQKVLDVAPNDPDARGALGFVQLNGQWMTEEQSYRARGYVKHDGEWMTPKEAELSESAAAAEQARADAEQRADQAEADKAEADSRAEKAEEAARQAQESASSYYRPPVYWGGWGYGVTRWPSTADERWRSGYRPTNAGSTRGRSR